MRSWDTPRRREMSQICAACDVSAGAHERCAGCEPGRRARSTRRARPCRSSSATTTRAGATRGCVALLDLFAARALPVDLAVIPRGAGRGARARAARAAGGRPAPARARARQPRARGAQVRVRARARRGGSARATSRPAASGSPTCSATASTRSSRRRGTAARADTGRCLAELGFARALARGARGAARRARPARAAGERRLVRPPPRRAAEPGGARRTDRPRRSAQASRSG